MSTGAMTATRHNNNGDIITISTSSPKLGKGLAFTNAPIEKEPNKSKNEKHTRDHDQNVTDHDHKKESSRAHHRGKQANHKHRSPHETGNENVFLGLNRDSWNHTINKEQTSLVVQKEECEARGKVASSDPVSENTLPLVEAKTSKKSVTAEKSQIENSLRANECITPDNPSISTGDIIQKCVTDQKPQSIHEAPQSMEIPDTTPLNMHSPIKVSESAVITVPSNQNTEATSSELLYKKRLELYGCLLALEKESAKVSISEIDDDTQAKLSCEDYRKLRNNEFLSSCLTIERSTLPLISTDVGRSIYQPKAMHRIYKQMHHGVEPVSIAQDRLLIVRKKIHHDRHALNRMMGSEAKQELKKHIYGNRYTDFNITDVFTKTIATVGTLEQPDITNDNVRSLRLLHHYPLEPPSKLLFDELEDIVKISPKELMNFKFFCVNMIAELGYVLNQVTNSNSKAVASKVVSILSSCLISEKMQFLGISLLIFCNCILEKAALEHVFVPVYVSIFSEVIYSAALSKQILANYPSYNKLFKAKCAEKQLNAPQEQLSRQFMIVTFRGIMEIKLEDMLYNVDIEIPFFRRIEIQHNILDKMADGTVIKHGEQEQKLIREYIKELQNIYFIGLAEFSAYLYIYKVRKTSNMITPAALKRIFLNLVCYNSSYNYIVKTDTWSKYIYQPYFNKFYIPAVNMEINRLYIERRYRKQIKTMQFSADKYLPNYSLYEAAVAMMKIIVPYIQYYPVDIYSQSFKVELDALLGTSKVPDNKDSAKNTLFESIDSLRNHLCDEQFYSILSSSDTAKNYNMMLKYLFANTPLIDMAFPYFKMLMQDNGKLVYQILSENNLDDLLKDTADDVLYYTTSKHHYVEDYYKETHLGMRSPGEVIHKLAETFGLDKSILDKTKLCSDIFSLYTRYVTPLKNDTTHMYHFRFMLIELDEEVENWFTKFPTRSKVDAFTRLEKRISNLVHLCRTYSILPANRPPNAANINMETNNSSSYSVDASNTSSSRVCKKDPILTYPAASEERDALIETLRTETLESSLLSALQFVLNLDYDQELCKFITKSVVWNEILSGLFFNVACKANTHTGIISAVVSGVPAVVNSLDEDSRDLIPSLLELLLDEIISYMAKDFSDKESSILINNFAFLIVSLMHKQILDFSFGVRTMASYARKTDIGHTLSKLIITQFLAPANDDDDLPSQKLFVAAKQVCLKETAKQTEKVAIFNLVNNICAVFTKKLQSQQNVKEVYEILKNNNAVRDVFTTYSIVVCENAIHSEKLPISTIVLKYFKDNDFLFEDENITDTYEIALNVAMSFLSSASKDEILRIFHALGEMFMSRCIPISIIATHVCKKWKETLYCSTDFIFLWNLLIDSKLCTKEAVMGYLDSIPSFTDIKKQIQESQDICAWLLTLK